MKLHPVVIVAGGTALLYGVGKVLARTSDDADPTEGEFWPITLFENIDNAANLISSVVTGNRRLTVAKVNAAGVVLDTPSGLVQSAATVVDRDVDTDSYSLARAIRSEASSGESESSKLYRAHVIINLANSRGLTVTQLALAHTNPDRDGHYGRQIGGAFATTQDPYVRDLELAEQARSESDSTGGAIQFSDRNAFGVQAGTTNWSNHVAQRESEGKTGGLLPGAPSTLVFWWRGFLPSNARAI